MCKFRELKADEIEVRVQSAKETGCVLLLYKDARCDMRILDETVGAENWQREHYECKGNLFCRVGIYNPERDSWAWKSDCGTESNTEAQKGEASDSFKRACFNWGIGRELYTSPFIWIPADKCRIVRKGQGFACYDNFSVKSIQITDGKIVSLEIENAGKVCYSMKPKMESDDGGLFRCEICGDVIVDKNGEPVTKAVMDKLVKKYGRQICSKCVKETENA